MVRQHCAKSAAEVLCPLNSKIKDRALFSKLPTFLRYRCSELPGDYQFYATAGEKHIADKLRGRTFGESSKVGRIPVRSDRELK